MRGTPHNLSKVSLEVKGSEITREYTTTSKQSQIRLVKNLINPGKAILSLYDCKLNHQKDLVHHGKEPSSLKKAIYSFTLDVIAILKKEQGKTLVGLAKLGLQKFSIPQ